MCPFWGPLLHPWVNHKRLIGFGFESFDRYDFGLKEKEKKKLFNTTRDNYCLSQLKPGKIFERIVFFKVALIRSWLYWKLIFRVQ